MKKTFTLSILLLNLFILKSFAQDGLQPPTGIINTITKQTLPPVNNDNNLLQEKSFNICDSLNTAYDPSNSISGVMFDIVNIDTQSITIKGFDVYPQHSTGFEIYTHGGTFVGSENNPPSWTLVGLDSFVTARPAGNPTRLPMSIPVIIGAAQTAAFYITTRNDSSRIYYTNGTGTAPGTQLINDGKILIQEGSGVQYRFSGTPFTPRKFNGTVRYCYQYLGIDNLNYSTLKTTVSPNPFSNYTTIKIEDTDYDTYTLKLTDVLGKEISAITNITSKEVKIEKGKLNSGIYIYHISSRKGALATGKLIVE